MMSAARVLWGPLYGVLYGCYKKLIKYSNRISQKTSESAKIRFYELLQKKHKINKIIFCDITIINSLQSTLKLKACKFWNLIRAKTLRTLQNTFSARNNMLSMNFKKLFYNVCNITALTVLTHSNYSVVTLCFISNGVNG